MDVVGKLSHARSQSSFSCVGLGKWHHIKHQFFAKHLCNCQSRGKLKWLNNKTWWLCGEWKTPMKENKSFAWLLRFSPHNIDTLISYFNSLKLSQCDLWPIQFLWPGILRACLFPIMLLACIRAQSNQWGAVSCIVCPYPGSSTHHHSQSAH